MDEPERLHDAVTMPLAVGITVFSADGQQLGHIREVVGDSFKVDAPLKRDYWLSRHSVLSASPDRVTVMFDEAELDRFRLDRPSDLSHQDQPKAAGEPRGVVEPEAHIDERPVEIEGDQVR